MNQHLLPSGAPADWGHCQGVGRGQGEGRRRWKFRKSWLNSAQQQGLWDIRLSLALSCLALEILLLHWAQGVSGQQRGQESWSAWSGCREQGTWEARITTDWRSKCNSTTWFQWFGPLQEASKWGHSPGMWDVAPKLEKRGICWHSDLFRKVGFTMCCRVQRLVHMYLEPFYHLLKGKINPWSCCPQNCGKLPV